MSKSLGNIVLARDFIQKYSGETLKFLILSGHYRSVIDFSEKHIQDCLSGLHRIYSTIQKATLSLVLKPTAKTPSDEEKRLEEFALKFPTLWQESMEDDFNTAKALGFVFEYVRAVNAALDKKGFKASDKTASLLQTFLTQMKELSGVLNLLGENPNVFLQTLRRLILQQRGIEESWILETLKKRSEARAAKNFSESDRLRDELVKRGVEIRDRADGTDWDVF